MIQFSRAFGLGFLSILALLSTSSVMGAQGENDSKKEDTALNACTVLLKHADLELRISVVQDVFVSVLGSQHASPEQIENILNIVADPTSGYDLLSKTFKVFARVVGSRKDFTGRSLLLSLKILEQSNKSSRMSQGPTTRERAELFQSIVRAATFERVEKLSNDEYVAIAAEANKLAYSIAVQSQTGPGILDSKDIPKFVSQLGNGVLQLVQHLPRPQNQLNPYFEAVETIERLGNFCAECNTQGGKNGTLFSILSYAVMDGAHTKKEMITHMANKALAAVMTPSIVPVENSLFGRMLGLSGQLYPEEFMIAAASKVLASDGLPPMTLLNKPYLKFVAAKQLVKQLGVKEALVIFPHMVTELVHGVAGDAFRSGSSKLVKEAFFFLHQNFTSVEGIDSALENIFTNYVNLDSESFEEIKNALLEEGSFSSNGKYLDIILSKMRDGDKQSDETMAAIVRTVIAKRIVEDRDAFLIRLVHAPGAATRTLLQLAKEVAFEREFEGAQTMAVVAAIESRTGKSFVSWLMENHTNALEVFPQLAKGLVLEIMGLPTTRASEIIYFLEILVQAEKANRPLADRFEILDAAVKRLSDKELALRTPVLLAIEAISKNGSNLIAASTTKKLLVASVKVMKVQESSLTSTDLSSLVRIVKNISNAKNGNTEGDLALKNVGLQLLRNVIRQPAAGTNILVDVAALVTQSMFQGMEPVSEILEDVIDRDSASIQFMQQIWDLVKAQKHKMPREMFLILRVLTHTSGNPKELDCPVELAKEIGNYVTEATVDLMAPGHTEVMHALRAILGTKAMDELLKIDRRDF